MLETLSIRSLERTGKPLEAAPAAHPLRSSSGAGDRVPVILYTLATFGLIFNEVRHFGVNVSIPDALYVATLGWVIWRGLADRRPAAEWLPIHPLWIAAVLILAGGLLSSANAAEPFTSLAITLKACFVFSAWISLGVVMARRGQTARVLKAFLLGVVGTSLVAIYDFVSGAHLGQTISGDTLNRWGRYGGTLGHPNTFGGITAVAIPLLLNAVLCQINRRKSIPAAACLAGLLVVVTGSLLSGSTSSYMSWAAGSAVVAGSHLVSHLQRGGDWRERLWLVGIVGGAGIGLALLFGQVETFQRFSWDSIVNRVTGRTGPERLELIDQAMRYLETSPGIGAGMDQSGTGELEEGQLVTRIYVHNTIIQSWVAGGILALLGVLFLYARSLSLAASTLWNGFRRRAAWGYELGLAASIIGKFLFDMVQPTLYSRYAWLPAALLLGLVWNSDESPPASSDGVTS